MTKKIWSFIRLWPLSAAFLMLSACGARTDLYTGLAEKDANQVVSALVLAGIQSEKVQLKQGFAVRVQKDELAKAVSLLSSQGLPNSSYQRMGDVFKKDGVVSTPIEERSRYLYALSQELENTLNQIDGVIAARVHPVLPERLIPGEPALPSSCSVLIKHRSDWDPSLYEERIRRLMLSSIPGLSRAHPSAVSIVFVPVTTLKPLSASSSTRSEGRVSVLEWFFLGALLLVIAGASAGLFVHWRRERGAAPNHEEKVEAV